MQIKTNKISCEDDILAIIAKYFNTKNDSILLDKGDDCAVLNISNNNENIVISTDIFAEDSHFRRSYFSASAIGYKALAVNISDIYAMGAKPINAQLALSLPKNIEKEYLEELFESMASLAKEHNIVLSGGDISLSDKLCLTITLLGLVDKEVELYRKNAEIGDIIYISAPVSRLGNARLALNYLEKNNKNINQNILDAHLFPPMYGNEALQIAKFAKQNREYKFSLMDISDGLAQDIPRLIAPYGINLSFSYDDINLDIKDYCIYNGIDPLEFILKGGEDYILLGTCPNTLWQTFIKACPSTVKIGEVIDKNAIVYNSKTLKLQGYDHFCI